jgi:hypothetical protein
MKAFGLNWDNPDSLRMNPDTHRDDQTLNDLDTLPTYFRFSTVRNPFDRFISGWKYFDAEPEAKRLAEKCFQEDLEFFGYCY